jgi:hypothetical protein
MELIELERKQLSLSTTPRLTVRELFRRWGAGMLILDSRKIEWYFDDGTVYAITVGRSIDERPLTHSRRRQPHPTG